MRRQRLIGVAAIPPLARRRLGATEPDPDADADADAS